MIYPHVFAQIREKIVITRHSRGVPLPFAEIPGTTVPLKIQLRVRHRLCVCARIQAKMVRVRPFQGESWPKGPNTIKKRELMPFSRCEFAQIRAAILSVRHLQF